MPFGAHVPSVRADLFGGKGVVAVHDLLGARLAPPFAAALGCVLEAGGRVGRHRQQQCPEIVIGLGGEGEIEVDRRARPFGPGDVVYLPLGSVLAIRNLSAEAPLEYLIVKAWLPAPLPEPEGAPPATGSGSAP